MGKEKARRFGGAPFPSASERMLFRKAARLLQSLNLLKKY